MKKFDFRYTLNADEIPTPKIMDITPAAGSEPHVNYACPDNLWKEHHEAWCKASRHGNKDAPHPMPWGHCMFQNPVGYGMVPYGCTDQAMIRKAHENDVRALLNGWDRDLTKEELDKIVNATVDARLAGKNVGASPFVACIMTVVRDH